MTAGKIYRHRNTLDTDIYILSEADGSFEVMYLHRHSKRLQVESSEWVEIENFDHWAEVKASEYPETLIKYLHNLREVF